MSYIEKHLIEGEEIVYATRLHWIVLLGPILLALVLGLPGLALAGYYVAGAGSRDQNSTYLPLPEPFSLLLPLFSLA